MQGNRSLKWMNALNDVIKAEKFSFKKGVPLAARQFVISSTTLSREEYGDSPLKFVRSLGISKAEWEAVGEVTVLRSCVLTPYLTPEYIAKDYVEVFKAAIHKALEEIVGEGLLPGKAVA